MKTRTGLELKDIYISLLMETLSEDEFKSECERVKYLLGVHPKRCRDKQESEFISRCEELCYNGSTTRDLFIEKTGVDPVTITKEIAESKFGSVENAQLIFNDCGKTAKELIDNNFTVYSSELNDILNK